MQRLVIVLALLALVAGTARAETPQEKAWQAARRCLSTLGTLSLHVEQFGMMQGHYPESLAQLEGPPAVCPSAMAPTYRYQRTRLGYVIYCAGAHHTRAGLKANQPRAERTETGEPRITPPELERWATLPRGGESLDLKSCKGNLRNLRVALEMWAQDHGRHYPERLAEVKTYMQVPTCPAAGRDTYSASYRVSGRGYTLFCKGHHHRADGLGRDQP